jgi:hypothetical protein
MSMNKIRTSNPSRVALPMHGRAFGMRVSAQRDAMAGLGVWEPTSARALAMAMPATDGTTDAIPGNPAWRPPNC